MIIPNQNTPIVFILFILIATPIHGFVSLTHVSAQTTRLPNKQTTSQLKEPRQKQIPIATTIEGTLTTPIIWTDDSQLQETRATITLNEPLLYSDGDIALPENSSLIVEVSDWDDAGFVTLNAIAIIYENNQEKFTQSEIPEGTLLVRNENNQPLKFETENSGNGNSLISGLVGEALQTGSRELPVPGRISSSVSRTLRQNIRRSRRSSRRNSEQIYSLEKGTLVSIFVNSFISIR